MVKMFQEEEVIKVLLPSMFAVLLFVISQFFVTLPSFKNNLIAKKKETISEVTQIAFDILSYHHLLEKNGIFTRQEAQHRAIQQIKSLRYGKDLKDYFWINDTTPRMVMHPYRPELDGQDLSQFADPNGTHLFIEFVKTVEASQSGYVEYLWQWKDNPDLIVHKQSFVRSFAPWNWIIGTGVYTRDVELEIAVFVKKLVSHSTVILLLVSLLCLYIVKQGLKAANTRKAHDKQMQKQHDHLEEMVYERTKSLQLSNKKLSVSEERYRKLIETANDAIFVSDIETEEILQANKSAETLLGIPAEQIIGKKLSSLLYPPEQQKEFHDKFRAHYLQGQGVLSGLLVRHRENFHIPVEIGVSIAKWSDREVVQGIFRDITKRKKMERDLCQAQKLEAVGRLAGGIAHDFNNILTAILGFSEITLLQLPSESSATNNLKKVMLACYRARDLVSQILSFSRFPFGEEGRKSILLQESVRDALKLLRSTIPSTIAFKYNFEPTCPPVLANFTQVQQIIFNLCTNASHSMQATGGIMEIYVYTEEISETLADSLAIQPGEYAVFAVQDSGSGMDETTLLRIFDPYFTTKNLDEGTGLGLATVQGIVKSHKGGLRVQSEVNQGSRFEVFLPIAEHPPQHVSNADTNGQHKLMQLCKTVLFVDDEIMIAQLGEMYLEQAGCNVTACNSSIKALEKFKKNPDSYDVVVTDQSMPAMSGLDLAQKIKEIRPNIPVIITTGYSDMVNEKNIKEQGIDAFIKKPITLQSLICAIKNVLP
ncbi:MAG: cache domain-containing protein [Desulfobulbaceae bacterium]|nr:cache domain-containing protein [Desulfobulbaceae bacterium]